MTSPRRQREWRNESALGSAVSDTGQVTFPIADGLFNKGCTLVRTILNFAAEPVTLTVTWHLYVALWVGQASGVPSNISSDSEESYVFWRSMHGRVLSGTNQLGPMLERIDIDLRSQRISRSDSDRLNIIIRASGSDMVFHYSTRVLCLLP